QDSSHGEAADPSVTKHQISVLGGGRTRDREKTVRLVPSPDLRHRAPNNPAHDAVPAFEQNCWRRQ
ncbi:MAG TPA: hypothetical protein VGE84_00855, partial [Allosphingosinicella sp.]